MLTAAPAFSGPAPPPPPPVPERPIRQLTKHAADATAHETDVAPRLDVLEEMDALSRLHRGGLLTDTEFAAKRSQLLEVL